ncbi:MAG: DUF58 domain-containing protein [Nanoarchaeota archaeon]|nr:DUF58 domain-containing protein [Nanoarchaeota archaeon]
MIDTSFLHQLDRFNIVLKKRIHSAYSGSRESQAAGSGLVFKDHRQNVLGDDLRAIDWKVYARTDEYFIKRYEEERNMRVHIIIDSSASMNFGRRIKKFEYASMIGIGFAYMALRDNEKFEISTFSERLHRFRPRKGANQLISVLDQLNSLKLDGRSKFAECLEQYKEAIKTKALVIIISDFLFDLSKLRDVLFRFRKSEVLVVQVLDTEEVNLGIEGDVILQDSENPVSWLRTFITNRLRNNYEGELSGHTAKVKNTCETMNIKFLQVSTDKPIFDTFYELLRK